jgi:flagellar M-ring protein FliF
MGAAADERKINYERRLREQVDQIVTSVVGPGRARVQLNAEFDFNRITQTSDRYDPEGRVVRSSQTREEQSQSADKEGQVSVGNELPNGQKPDNAAARGDQAKKTEEIVNYEISRTTKTEVTEAGRINRVSVAVVVDGLYVKNDKGEITYQPRTKEEIDRIAALVRSAIGFDQKRGDQVEVVNLRFAEQPAIPGAGESSGVMSLLQFTKDDIMRAIEMGVMMLLGLVVMFMVVRPLMRKAFGTDVKALPAPGQAAAPGTLMLAGAAGDAGVAAGSGSGGGISSSGGPNVAIVGGEESVAISNRTSNMIDVAQVQGQVHAQSVQKVGELANKNPQEAISIIRNWLHEDAA